MTPTSPSPSPVIWIFSTGTEILQGHHTDRNSPEISARLHELGLQTARHVAIPDNADALREALSEAAARAHLVITTGGLGPTVDDMNRPAMAEAWGVDLVENAEALERIRERYRRRELAMPESNRKQAFAPRGSVVLQNDHGTAPGFYLRPGPEGPRATLLALPGPPREMRPMFEEGALPLILEQFGGRPSRFRTLKMLTHDIPEALVNERIEDLFEADTRVGVALLAAQGRVEVRLTLMGETGEENDRLEHDWRERIHGRLGAENIITEGDEGLETVIGRLLRERGQTVATAESCTGGQIAGRITDVAGSSEYFIEGFITYANRAKLARIGVNPDLLARHGAVSIEVAGAMATGTREIAGTDWAVSVSGIAGPGGGSADKPVGLVFIGLAGPDGVAHAQRRQFVGNRAEVRLQTVQTALDMLRRGLIGAPIRPTLAASMGSS